MELSSLRESSQQQERRLREMEEEVRTHTTTSRMVTKDLESWYMKEQAYDLPHAKEGWRGRGRGGGGGGRVVHEILGERSPTQMSRFILSSKWICQKFSRPQTPVPLCLSK